VTIPVRLSKEAQSDFVALDGSIQARARRVLARLAAFPDVTGAVPLRGDRAGQFKIVVAGDWRLIFDPRGGVVMVVEIKHRSVVYD
jgi:mRNA-degrading endonuclease RelE of RelBE toxin-antitoxin system